MGMRCGIVSLVACAVLAVTHPARAGVENTHHDMRLYSQEDGKSVCSYCHVTHGAASEKLLSRKGAYEGELGRIGDFCYTCHDGTVLPTALIEAPDGTLGLDALTRSHGLRIADLGVRTGGLEGPDAVARSGLVSVDPATGALPDRMECSACHDPHSAENAPFLRVPIEELCQKCHSGRNGIGLGRWTQVEDAGAANGPHPVGMPVIWSGKDRVRPGQPQPEMTFNAVDLRLKVPGLVGEALRSPTAHWATGGHLGGLGSDVVAGRVICSTCHSAHSVSADLLLGGGNRELSGDDPLCAGCHGGPGTPQNPGGTPFYHPAQAESRLPYRTSTTPSRALLIELPSEWPVGKDGALLCSTCHRAHQGRAGTKCLRDSSRGKQHVCDVCHRPEEDVVPENSHHFTTATDRSAILQGRTLSWAGASGQPGDLSDGLTCVDCHTELGKSAHNW